MIIAKVSKKKIRIMKELVELILKSNSIIISSAKGIPAAQLQKIRKKLREIAEMRVVKEKVMIKAIEEASKKEKEVEELKNHLQENSVILFSNKDPFELAALLAENRSPVKARAGQVALTEIKIPSGPTDIPAGPMISELSGLGIKIAIEGGKITIKQDSVVAKEGEKISEAAAGILAKLEILPFSVGLESSAIFSTKEKKIFLGVRIDKEKAEKEIIATNSKAFAFAIHLAYPCKETILNLLGKANLQYLSIIKITGGNF